MWLLPLALVVAGCGAPPPEVEPIVVTVSPPVERPVTKYIDFTGRTQAVDSVNLQARVGGYLEKVKFKDGDYVQKDQVLFEIDDRSYKDARDQARAEVKLAEAQVQKSEADYRRNVKLRESGSVSQSELDKSLRARDSAQGAVAAAKANLEEKQLDLDYCQVKAPISGHADRALITVGNLVSANTSNATVLTTIVTVEPIYVYFNVDEPTLLRLQKLVRDKAIRSPDEKSPEVLLGIGSGDDYPFPGKVDFIANKVDPDTGTISARGLFPNKERVLIPGMFARIRAPIGDPHPALLVSERALGSNQGQRYVYVVGDDDKVVERRVKLGAMADGLRIIEEGLKPGERVIIDGLYQVKPGLVVKPKEGKMEPGPAAANTIIKGKDIKGKE
jgi:RND family efflux transporter MFP subunit